MLQVAKAAVDQATGPPGRAVTDIALLDETGGNTSIGSIPRNTRTIDAATDNNQVEIGFGLGFIVHGDRKCRVSNQDAALSVVDLGV